MPDPGSELTILSHGLGQDSAALTELLLRDRAFRTQYAPGRLIVVTSDTGNEHPETTEYRKTYVEPRLRDAGIPYYFIATTDGYHTGAWNGGLIGQWEANGTIGASSFPPSCSDSLKIAPIWKRVETIVEADYGFRAGQKKGLKAFAQAHGKIRCIIGFARGEEKRVADPQAQLMLFGEDPKPERNAWMREAVERVYPLIALGWNRADAQQYLASVGAPVPVPSNCMGCAYKSPAELLWTERRYPDFMARWKALEAAKLERCKDEPKNHGVRGWDEKNQRPVTIEDGLARARRDFAGLSDAELDAALEQNRMTHGHSAPSRA
jgi:hypothetical protein